MSTDALDLLLRQVADEFGLDLQSAFSCSVGVSVPDQFVGTPLDCLPYFGPEPAAGGLASIATDELVIEPGRAVAGHLSVEVVGAEDTYLGLTAPAGLVGNGPGLKIRRNEPAVGI